VFEIYYGPSSASNQSGYNTTNGPNIGLFYSLKSFSKMFEKIWINGAPGSYTIDSAKTVVFNAASGVPVSGTMLRFIPKKVAAGILRNAVKDVAEIYPNPSDDIINVRLQQPFALPVVDVTLYDISGKTITSYKIDGRQQSFTIPVRNIPGGTYTLTLQAGTETYSSLVEISH